MNTPRFQPVPVNAGGPAPRRAGRRPGWLALLACGLLAAPAWAGGDRLVARSPAPPAFQQECGACHLAYPPALLPAASWQRLMDGLPQHFGTDASLDAATRQEIGAWLAAHAGTFKKVAREGTPPQDRISRANWFVREHHEVDAATWSRPAIKSASQCSACHTQAEQGDFSERQIRIPR